MSAVQTKEIKRKKKKDHEKLKGFGFTCNGGGAGGWLGWGSEEGEEVVSEEKVEVAMARVREG